MLEVHHVSKSFAENQVLDHIDLTLAAGECWCIVGVNGAGKTTLLRCILNAYPLDEGTITVWLWGVAGFGIIISVIGVSVYRKSATVQNKLLQKMMDIL
ncbi:MAG: ATP-binding cassette domain-containing protein [Bacteroidota bacterium]